ncbi:LacI family DNA-binding transcriptional regulator [Actinoallomurus acaciae]|uniref:LacI family DNA-binding transcriptional regulator n=1 Tax=Actinoallomurus acaciae TaxID=502577 RepID=A0ABV5Y908_9ACTN
MARGRRPTQADIARVAGVSQATVSLVLNERAEPSGITAATRQRVAQAIRQLGYVPNPAARTLAGGMNKILGFYTFESVFPLDGDDFYFPFLMGIEEETESLGYDLLMFNSTGRERQMFANGSTRLALADGTLLLGREPNLADICRLRDDGYRFVYIGRRDVPGGGISYVTADYTRATREVTERLIGLGHRRFARYRLREATSEAARDREDGFRSALAEAELKAPPTTTLESPEDALVLFEHAVRSGVTALVVDQQSIAEVVRAHAADTRSAGDLSIAVLGDTMGTRSDAGPPLEWSGFRIPRKEMGAAATRALVDKLEADVEEPVEIKVPCELVNGETVSAR